MMENKRIIHILVVMCVLFLSLIIYLTYFELFVKDTIISNSYNRRQWEVENSTIRGSIYDRNGVTLAESSKSSTSGIERVYPYGPLYSQVIGYDSRSYGRSLLEEAYNDYLLNLDGFNAIFNFRRRPSSGIRYGDSIYLTLDHKLQVLAEDLLGSRNGAVVAMNPATGEILAMVSKPDYDPNSRKLSEKWQQLVESEEHPFLPRATQGLYAPGSTFKIVTAAAAFKHGLGDFIFDDRGTTVIDGKPFSNTGKKPHGEIDIKHALAVSSNTFFAQLGVKLGSENLLNMAEDIGMEKNIPFDIPVSVSRFPYKTMGQTDMAAAAIGQGKVLVTPLHMAMIVAGAANNGIMMKPYLVSSVVSHDKKKVHEFEPSRLYTVMPSQTAQRIKDMMQEVVRSGTGKNAAIKGIEVAGKTGTAENELTANENDKQHTWFVAFAPVDSPKIAVAVVLEYSGSTGGKLAAPIARQIMAQYLNKK